MSSQTVEAAIRDVAPALPEPFPEQLKQLTNQLYSSSKQKIGLKSNEEVARLHLSAIIAVQKLQTQLNITDPSLRNLPIPTRLARTLLDVFQTQLNSNSTASTPMSTPRLKRTRDNLKTPTPSPSKKAKMGRPPGSKTKTPFLRKLEAAGANTTPTKEGTPIKDLTEPLREAENAEIENTPNTSPFKSLQLLTSREIITLCNKFQLQKDISDHIIDTFLKFSSHISNEWILIVGLILNCYFVINHKELDQRLGNRSSVFKTMHFLQKGGLKLVDIQSSVDVVQEIICYSKWFKKLKTKYDYPLDEGTGFEDFGNMYSESYQYSSNANVKKYKEWVFEIKQSLQ